MGLELLCSAIPQNLYRRLEAPCCSANITVTLGCCPGLYWRGASKRVGELRGKWLDDHSNCRHQSISNILRFADRTDVRFPARSGGHDLPPNLLLIFQTKSHLRRTSYSSLIRSSRSKSWFYFGQGHYVAPGRPRTVYDGNDSDGAGQHHPASSC